MNGLEKYIYKEIQMNPVIPYTYWFIIIRNRKNVRYSIVQTKSKINLFKEIVFTSSLYVITKIINIKHVLFPKKSRINEKKNRFF